MPQSLSKVYVHITFSTKHRENLINNEIQDRLYEYLGGACRALECNPVSVGGYYDHVHILCTLSRKITQAGLLQELKRGSSKWVKTLGAKYQNFYWQDGYGIFSVKPSEINVVVDYIKNQKEHHKTKTFKKEFRGFLKKNNVEYDEKYVWD
ncbi:MULTISPECIES: IS200/IS605 family transposase [unclassified Saccharicrinis]|uniref:IS200/IS605 family transposase n=1 Tax=unclassified Saccharicrinis TaxID=2646859 RepID=UPI003D337400